MICLFATSSYVIGQRRPAPKVTEIEATTAEGKTVILRSDGTWRYAESANRSTLGTTAKKATLEIETGIIYRTGEVMPVARTTFYVLDDNAITIAKAAGIQPRSETLSIFKDIDKALVSDISTSLAGQYQNLYADFGATFLKAIEPHIIAKFMTDFSGKASVPNLEAKQYYLFGAGATRRSSALWNLPIDLSKETHIVLDQNNAATAY
jgi:hypothetical protein